MYLVYRQGDDKRLVVALADDPPLCHSSDVGLLTEANHHISSIQE